MIFEYTALDVRGEQCNGTIPAENEVGAIRTLRDKGLYPIRINPSKKKEDHQSLIPARPEHPSRTYTSEPWKFDFRSYMVGIISACILLKLVDIAHALMKGW